MKEVAVGPGTEGMAVMVRATGSRDLGSFRGLGSRAVWRLEGPWQLWP